MAENPEKQEARADDISISLEEAAFSSPVRQGGVVASHEMI